ncbi:hypothetical protein HJG60_008650 [Phyllostomus discolor]|uniref:Uncharacterized protein n=1 Tax=Phyllostomus discolor TaxID=89673 RepID=A0A833Z0J7_9CHIR|nr:hypothetical protein HJG60_008650 [Phyllostomus discolor]
MFRVEQYLCTPAQELGHMASISRPLSDLTLWTVLPLSLEDLLVLAFLVCIFRVFLILTFKNILTEGVFLLLLEREEGGDRERERNIMREREKHHERERNIMRERNISQVPPMHAPSRDQTHNLVMRPDWELNLLPLLHRMMNQLSEAPGQGKAFLALENAHVASFPCFNTPSLITRVLVFLRRLFIFLSSQSSKSKMY